MVELVGRMRCSGCAACVWVCPKHAIELVADEEGFLSPRIDKSVCVECGKCQISCPAQNRGARRVPMKVYAAYAKDRNLRSRSSSGGMFSLLAQNVLKRGGVVFGAALCPSDGLVRHQAVDREEDLPLLRGSKYVQSEVGNVYLQARDLLDAGRWVLFSGTPCQIIALHRVLNHTYPNLLTVDVICHGVPSPLAWKNYLKSHVGLRFSSISFRDKKLGWFPYSISYDYKNGGKYSSSVEEDAFLRGFQADLYTRQSCHNCTVREFRSGSDLTIGDYWQVGSRYPTMDDGLGTSAVLVHTDQGEVAFSEILEHCVWAESDAGDVSAKNPALVRSSLPHPRRQEFFTRMRQGCSFDETVIRLLRRSVLRRVGSRMKRLLTRVFA